MTRRELRILRQIAEARGAPNRDVARIGALDTGHDPEERGFARTVHTDESDFLGVVDRKRRIIKKDAAAKALMEAADVQDVYAGPPFGISELALPTMENAGFQQD